MPKRRASSAKTSRSPADDSGRRRLPKWAAVLLWIVGGALTAAVVLLLTAALLILTPPPEPMAELSAADAQLQQQILAKVSREVFNGRPPAESQMRLTPLEVNSMLHFAVFAVTAAERLGAVARRDAEMIRRGRYAYRPGVFSAEIPVLSGLPQWLLGGAAVLRLEGFPSKYDGKIDVAVLSCRLGRLPIPAGLAESIANRLIAALAKRDEMLCFDRAVKSFDAESNGDVTLVYRPPELLRLLVGGLK